MIVNTNDRANKKKELIKILGILKFGLSLLLSIGLIFSFFSLSKQYDVITSTLAITFVSLVSFCYVYYLIQTGGWNLKSSPYKINFLPLIGLLLHFIFIILLLFSTSKSLLVTSVILAGAAFSWGIYDLMQFYNIWKSKKLKIVQ